MARPFVIDPGVLGGGGDQAMMAMAMKLLGFGGEQEKLALDREEAEAMRRHREGTLGLERERLGAQKSQAEAAAGERAAAETQRLAEREEDIAHRTGLEKAASEKEKAAGELAERTQRQKFLREQADIGAFGPQGTKGQGTDNPVYKKLMREAEPQLAQKEKEVQEEAFAGQVGSYKALTPEQRRAKGIEAQYGGPENLKKIMAAAGIPELESAATAPTTEAGQAMKLLLNLPAAGRNVGRYFANIGPNIARSLGVETGTWPYEEFVDPAKFKEAQAFIGPGPVVGPAPEQSIRPQFGSYGSPTPVIPPPEWMYGVGTRR